MNEKVAIAFDTKAKEILENISPELRNAAVNIAVKMLAKDPIYKKYFCMNCEETEEDIADLEELDNNNNTAAATTNNNAQTNQNVVSWDAF